MLNQVLVVRPKIILEPSLNVRENQFLALNDAVLNDFINLLSVFSHSFRFPKFYTLEQQWEMSFTLHELFFRITTCLKQLNTLH